MDGEVIDALLGLLDEGILEDLPVELQRIAADLLQRLVDRHGADGHGRVAHDPRADVVDVSTSGEIHHRVGAPAGRPDQFLHLLRCRRGHGRIADIGVDLDEEVAADRHRLHLGVVDVGRDDGAAARHLVAHEFRCDEGGERGTEAVAVGQRGLRAFQHRLAGEVFAVGDVDHLLGDDPGFGELVLRHHLAGAGLADLARRRTGGDELVLRHEAVVLGLDRARRDRGVAALGDPRVAQQGQAGIQVDPGIGLGIGARRIVDPHRRLLRITQRDLAERHPDVVTGQPRSHKPCASP